MPRVLCLLPGRYSETICMTLVQWLRIVGRAEVRKGCTLHSQESSFLQCEPTRWKDTACCISVQLGLTAHIFKLCGTTDLH